MLLILALSPSADFKSVNLDSDLNMDCVLKVRRTEMSEIRTHCVSTSTMLYDDEVAMSLPDCISVYSPDGPE